MLSSVIKWYLIEYELQILPYDRYMSSLCIYKIVPYKDMNGK